MKSYITLKEPCEFDFVEKKSKFKGALYPVSSSDQANEKLCEIKKKYWDATHNCSAVIIGENKEFMRFSDDGEPQGTAGVPMLEVLKNSGLTNILAIATRYFGGILLGAGGLVRAYTKCVSGALAVARKIELCVCAVYELILPYSSYGKIENLIIANSWIKGDVIFEENVKITINVLLEQEKKFKDEITEAFLGSIVPQKKGEMYVERPVK